MKASSSEPIIFQLNTWPPLSPCRLFHCWVNNVSTHLKLLHAELFIRSETWSTFGTFPRKSGQGSVNLDDPNFDQPSISYAHNPRFSSIFHTSSLAEAATWTACSGRFSAIERDPWTADLGHEDTIRGGVTGLQAVTISDHQWSSVTISDHQWPSVTCSQQLWILQGSVCCFMGAQKFKRQEFHFQLEVHLAKQLVPICANINSTPCVPKSVALFPRLGFLVLICTQTCTVIIDNYSLYIWSMRLWEGAQRLETSRRNKDSALPRRARSRTVSVDVRGWSYR